VHRHVARLVVDYFAYAVRPGASARRVARRRLLRLRRASGCLGTSPNSSRGSSSTTSPRAGSSSSTSPNSPRVGSSSTNSPRVGSSSTNSPRVGSSSTTSPTPRVRVSRHVARLVVDYFAYAARLGALARRAARRRLLCLRRASECLGTSRNSSSTTSPRAGWSSTTTPTSRVRVPRHVARLVVDYFAYAASPGALARRAA
jgi:hypothetical protein